MNIQNWFPFGLTGLISLQSKGLSRVFSNTSSIRAAPILPSVESLALCAQCGASSPSPHRWRDLKPEEQDGDIHLLALLPFSNTKIAFRNSSCEIGTKIPPRQAVNMNWLLPEPFHTPPAPSYYSCAKLAPSLLCFPVSLWPSKSPTLVALTFSLFCKRVPPCP